MTMTPTEHLNAVLAEMPQEVRQKVELLRQRTGELVQAAAFEQSDRESRAQKAFEEIFALKQLSVWRTCSRDGSEWRVVWMGDSRSGTRFRKAVMIARKYGGEIIEVPLPEADALRARRWDQMARGLLVWATEGHGPEEWGTRLHFGDGAVLNPDGSMRPLS